MFAKNNCRTQMTRMKRIYADFCLIARRNEDATPSEATMTYLETLTGLKPC
jgi:hypothetical protein